MNSANDKQRARAAALAARDRILENDRKQRSAEACRKLEEHFANLFGPKATLAVYAAMGSEVDLECLARAAYARSWQVCFPFMVKDNAESGAPARMEFFLVDRNRFEEAHEGILAHPLHAWSRGELDDAGLAPVSPEHVDGVVVPLVAFDAAGNRLGYGGGNYDRFLGVLASARPGAAIVGVAFAEQRIAHVPTEPHDLPLPTIVVA